VAFTKDLRLIPCKQRGHSPLLFSVYNYTMCTWTLTAIIVQVQVHAIIVQVQVQTLFVNFVIANSIQVTIICFFLKSRTGEWSLNPLVCGAHSQNGNLPRVQFMLPPKFEYFAADVSQSNESCTRELRAYPRCTRGLRPRPRSDTLSSAILIMLY